MKASLRAAWTAALRSGEYPQTTGNFQNERGFCCLGVLCVVAGEPPNKNCTGNWSYVVKAIGLDNGTDMRLAGMNDGGHTFPVIADWIEANIPITDIDEIKDTL